MRHGPRSSTAAPAGKAVVITPGQRSARVQPDTVRLRLIKTGGACVNPPPAPTTSSPPVTPANPSGIVWLPQKAAHE